MEFKDHLAYDVQIFYTGLRNRLPKSLVYLLRCPGYVSNIQSYIDLIFGYIEFDEGFAIIREIKY